MTEVAEALIGLVVGLVVGIFLAWQLLRSRAGTDSAEQLDRWRSEVLPGLRRNDLASRRTGIKTRLGAEISKALFDFPYRHADARFVGHPVEYVVFDGYSEVKGREADAISSITFLYVQRRPGPAPREATLVEECLAGGRIRWLTWSLPAAEPPT